MNAQISPFLLLPFLFHQTHGGRRRHLLHAYTFIYAACSLDKFPPYSPYQSSLNQLLSTLTSSSARTLYSPFSLPNDTVPVFGLYQCRGDLSSRECAGCVAGAVNQIDLLCPFTCGATIQLDGCFLRYDREDFVGKLDYEVKHEKCSGRSGGGDGDFLRRKDEVLADLGRAAATGFRVSSAGEVEGYAQCLGNLAPADCAACLREGVSKVMAACGTSVAGDMFLGECYVRYWESGYYASRTSSDSWNQDDVGKMVAIIVGVIAGVALLVVLLSLCKKSFG